MIGNVPKNGLYQEKLLDLSIAFILKNLKLFKFKFGRCLFEKDFWTKMKI